MFFLRGPAQNNLDRRQRHIEEMFYSGARYCVIIICVLVAALLLTQVIKLQENGMAVSLRINLPKWFKLPAWLSRSPQKEEKDPSFHILAVGSAATMLIMLGMICYVIDARLERLNRRELAALRGRNFNRVWISTVRVVANTIRTILPFL